MLDRLNSFGYCIFIYLFFFYCRRVFLFFLRLCYILEISFTFLEAENVMSRFI